MGLILDDAAISVRLGTAWTGDAPEFTGTGTNFMARAREIRTNDELEKTDVRGAGQKRQRNRFHGAKAMLTLRGVVAASGSGWAFKGAGEPSPVGQWIEITTLPKTTFTTPDVFIGVITKWEWSGSMGEAQLEEIEVDLDADYEESA